MAYRQRNIPVTSKEESESQTDIRLLDSYLFDPAHSQPSPLGESHLRLSQIYGQSSLLRPFSDHHLLHEFAREIKDLKSLPFSQNSFAKRLQILQTQITGLLKRDLLIHSSCQGDEKWNSYYSTLDQKERDNLRLIREKLYTDRHVVDMQNRIDALQEEVRQLSLTLTHSHQALEENKLYASFFAQLGEIIQTSHKKGRDIETAFQDMILPLYNDANVNLSNLTRTINKDVHPSIRPVTLTLAKEFEKLLKEQQFGEERLSELLVSLLNNFKAVKGVDHMQQQFQLAQRAQLAETNYHNMLSLFRHELETLKRDQPYLKGSDRLDLLLRKLQAENLTLLEINGWMNLAVTHIAVRQTTKEDARLRELVGIVSGEFKRLYLKFPELTKHVSAEIHQLIHSQALVELIDGASIQRLKEILVYQVEVLRVDDVYEYENSKQSKLIKHLRVLVKYLFDELVKLKDRHKLEFQFEEGIVELLRSLALDCVDTELIIELFRPPVRYVEVPVVVENLVYESKTYEKGVAINKPSHVVLSEQKLEVVTVNKEVPVRIEVPVEHVVTRNIPLEVISEKAVSVNVNRDVIVDRVVEVPVEVPVTVEKTLPVYEREEVLLEVPIDRIIKDVEVRQVEKIVEVKVEEIRQIEKLVEKLVVCNEIRETVSEVEVRVPYIFKETEIREIERTVPYVIENEKEVRFKVEVPIEIKKQEVTFVELVEIREKPIVITNTVEKPVLTELKVEKEIVREVSKEIFIERSHFIKGDKEETLRQVEVFVDKPLIQEILVSKDTQIEKVVPLYITEQVPIINEVYVPYITEKVKEIEVEKVKVVPARQEVVKPIYVDKPVPVIVEKEVVKVEQQFIDRIVEKIVEVPRVVEIEKIVEKIVVVPRIVEKIIEVPKIIEKIVIVTEPQLQIVEIPIPQIVIQEVEVPIEIFVDRPIVCIEKEVERVEVEKIVERAVTEEKIVEVEIERRIPVEIIKEIPVETYRDRIEYQKVFIHETKVESIEVQVPLIVQEKVPFIVEKELVIHEIVQQPVYQKLYHEKEKPVVIKEEVLVVKQITVQKPIYHRERVEVPGPQTIVTVDQPVEVQVIHEKLVRESHYKEFVKEVVLEVEKIVPIIHQKIVSVPVNELISTPELIQVPKIVELVHYKEIPVDAPVRHERLQTAILQEIKQVDRTVEVPFEIEISREKIKEIVNEIKCFIVQEQTRDIRTEVEVLVPTQTQVVEVPAQPIIQYLQTRENSIQIEDKIYQKLVQKIVMLPQVVEIVKHVHHVSEVNQLGVAVDVDVNVHVEKYLGVTTELKKSLVDLLSHFRSNVGRQPDLKNLIAVIEKYLKYIDEWIAFPKLVEIEKEVKVEVEKSKVVVLERENKDKQMSLACIVEKLLNELKRIKQSHKIALSLDEDLLRIFFAERRGEEELDKKYEEYQQLIRKKYPNFSSWSESQPFVVHSFLQDHFALQNLVDEANRIQSTQQNEISVLKQQLELSVSKEHDILCYNKKMFDENKALINLLDKYRAVIQPEDYEAHMTLHRSFYDELLEGRSRILISTIERNNRYSESVVLDNRISEESVVSGQKESFIGELLGKVSRYESQSQNLVNKAKRLQSQVTKYNEELNIKNSIIKRLETDFQSKLSRAKQELSKNPNLSKEVVEENKKLLERTRALEKEISSEKQNFQKAKRELERSNENSKRDVARETQRREREIKELTERHKKELERELAKLKSDYERIKKEKERFEEEIAEIRKKSGEEIKSIREQQLSGATDKYNQLINQNLELRKKSELVSSEYEKLKKAASDNNTINEKEMNKLKIEIEKLNMERRESDKHKKAGFMDLPQETQLINRNIELQKKIKAMQAEAGRKGKDDTYLSQIKSLKENMKVLEIELQTTKKELQAYQKMRATSYQSGYKSGTYSSGGEYVVESSIVRSPKTIYKTAEQKVFVSPESVQSREERIEQLGSSSSRLSHQSSDQRVFSSYKPQMTLRQFMDTKHGDDKQKDLYIIFVMIKVIEEVEKEITKGNYYSHTPNNINILNFNPKQLDKMTIKFGVHIVNKHKDHAGLYLAPEILTGHQSSLKSVVFNLGIILDQLIHGSTFFRSMEEIQNMQIEFKVRGEKLNPILKNTLFEMMNKEASKRLELVEAKRRLSLQKYITAEGRSTVTTTKRYERKKQE